MRQENRIMGLSEQEAGERLLEYGENLLNSAKRTSGLRIFAGQFKDMMTLILLASTLLSVAMGEAMEAITIIVIVFVNALLGFLQEFRTEKALEALKRLTAPTARVIRDGKQRSILAAGLVPGDVIQLEAGNRVPADARITENISLQCDEALLSGESLPTDKDIGCMAYMGTIVTKGHGIAEITATGAATEMGKIAGMLHEIEEGQTPLQRKLGELGRYVAIACVAVCTVVSLTGVLRGEAIFDMLLTGISLAVAAVPEGLPAIVTISLALAVNRILKRGALIRRLHSVETLGCATVICTDKTGTLTENRMTAKRIFTLDYQVSVSGNGYERAGEFTIDGHRASPCASSTLRRLLDICVVCNNASLNASGEVAESRDRTRSLSAQSWEAVGDPTEIALLVMAAKANLTQQSSGFIREDELPFDSDRKRMTILVRDRSGTRRAFIKGAPDILMGLCKFVMTDQGVRLLTPELSRRITKANEDMARSAMRVLGFAVSEHPGGLADAERDMIFVGMAGMIDPPRREVGEAVSTCRRAKIRTIMVTGDHRDTAEAIARQTGILRDGDTVMTGAELDATDDGQLRRMIQKIAVFARVNPGHKLRIVRALKRRGDIVAMTGDGVNDAPAVKEADIGVAMGVTGTDVTKHAASIILRDDNFATLVAAIEEGRVVYGNIRKFIRYLLSCNIGEAVAMFAGMLMGLPVALLPIQILLVNLATDGLPALALSLEPGEPDTMTRKPRGATESIFSNGLAATILFRGCLIGLTTLAVFTTFSDSGGDIVKARTAALLTLIFTQLFHVFECKSETKALWNITWLNNPGLIGAVTTSVLLMIAVLYLPVLQTIFQTVPLTPGEYARVLCCAAIVPIASGIVLALPKKKHNDLELTAGDAQS